jgi:hypothetical protein
MDDPSHIAIYSRFFLSLFRLLLHFFVCVGGAINTERTCTIGELALFFSSALGGERKKTATRSFFMDVVTPAGVDIAVPNNSSVTVGSAPKGTTTTTTTIETLLTIKKREKIKK